MGWRVKMQPQVLEYVRPSASGRETTVAEAGFGAAICMIAVGFSVPATFFLLSVTNALRMRWTGYLPPYIISFFLFVMLVLYTVRPKRSIARALAYWVTYVLVLGYFAWILS